MGNWLQGIAEWVSDAIPNEITKLNNTWVGQIPYVGWAMKGLSAADNFSETYANTGNLGASLMHGGKGIMGQATDPYAFSEKNQPGFTDDWALNVGKVMNLGGALYGGNYMGAGQQGMGILGSLVNARAPIPDQTAPQQQAPWIPQQQSVMELPAGAGITMAPQVYDFSGMTTPNTASRPWMGIYG